MFYKSAFSEVRPESRYEGPLLSPSRQLLLLLSLLLRRSSYFWPPGMVGPSREAAPCSSASLVMPVARLT
jgi:hypothetical protein